VKFTSALTMRDQTSKAFAARLPAQEVARIEAAIEETGQTQSEFVRRAIRYYRSRNPDQIIALYPENSVNRWLAEMGADDA
jgi:predicted DNA-binding protein